MNTIYLRKESTCDVLLKNPEYAFAHKALAKKKDVVMYKNLEDVQAGKNSGIWMWFMKYKPSKREKSRVIGYEKFKIIWLQDL